MKIAVLVSGGVDSSVALRLLKDQGHDVTAFYLKIWLEDELSYLGDCPWQEDLSYVEQVCEQAQVPLQVINLQKEYWDNVITYVLAEIKSGRTPNPDILCNKRIKFGAFFNYLQEHYDYVASGHYASTITQEGKVQLQVCPDPVKDQTYFLSHMSQAQLSRVIFPLGLLTKAEVRALAQRYDLPNKDRKDSQGICFLGKIKFSDFIRHHYGIKQGNIIEAETGKKMGTHNGFYYYTIGQRQGLGLAGGPWYVVSKDPHNNIVYISRNYYEEDKHRNFFTITDANWISGQPPVTTQLKVKLRHGTVFNTCTLTNNNNDTYSVQLEQRDQGIAAGQFAVFYDGSVCLGSGIIAS